MGGGKLVSLLSQPFTYNPSETGEIPGVVNLPSEAFEKAFDHVLETMTSPISKRGAEWFMSSFANEYMNSGNEQFLKAIMQDPRLLRKVGTEVGTETSTLLRDVFLRKMLSAWQKNGGDAVAAFQAAHKAMP